MLKQTLKKTALSAALFGAASFAQADVLTTVKPLGFIASAITDGVTNTQVLLPTSASPHDYSLKPSDVEKLKSAQLVVWIGDEMETFLESSIEKLPEGKVLTLADIPEIEQLVEGSKKEDHDDDHDKKDKHDHDHKHEHKHDHDHKHEHKDHHHEHGHEHHHDEDWHVWLAPQASGVIAEKIAERLIQQQPEQKAKIEQNLAEFKALVSSKNSEITNQLANVKGKGYYTFHDAYGYFEQAYGLTSLGSFTINPTVAPGAKTLNSIKKNIAKHKAECLFTEPQFTPKVVESLSKNTKVKIGALDPLGASVELSKQAYPQFLQTLADQFHSCLAK